MKKTLLLVSLLGACVRPDELTCGDLVCPTNTVCVPEDNTCVDVDTIAVPAGDIELLDVPCDEPAMQILHLRNFGTAPISYRATSGAPGVTLDPAEAEVPAGDALDLSVIADPGSVSLPGHIIAGNITIETDLATMTRHIRTSAAGAVPVLVDSFNFGETSQNVPKDRTLSLRNDGTLSVGVSIAGLTAPFSATGATTINLGPGATGHFSASFAPTALADYHSTATLTYDGHVCDAPPASIDASGTATGSPLLLGESPVVFSPNATCASPAQTHPLALTNNLLTDATVTLSFGNSTAVDRPVFSTEDSIVIPSLSTVSVDVTRRATTIEDSPGDETGTLSLTMPTPSGPVTRTVDVLSTISAPVLTVTATTVSLDATAAVAGATTVWNHGNKDANIRIEPPSGIVNGYRVSVSPSEFPLKVDESKLLTFTIESGDVGSPKREAPQFHTKIIAGGACSPSWEITALVPQH